MAESKIQTPMKGDQIMIFFNGHSIAQGTSHTLSETVNMQEISSKDYGIFGAQTPQKINWTISAEHLFTEGGFKTLQTAMHAMQPVDIVFGTASNWDKGGLDAAPGEGGTTGADDWVPVDNAMTGKAYISSLTLTAASGDNATFAAEFQGLGQLTEWE